MAFGRLEQGLMILLRVYVFILHMASWPDKGVGSCHWSLFHKLCMFALVSI